jgi:hypothetical protein
MTEATLFIRWDSGAYGLLLPEALEKISPAVLERKAFRVLLTEAYRPDNKGVVEFLDDYLSRWVAEHKQAWDTASVEFQHHLSDKNKAALLRQVKSTKRTYDRAAGILQRWETAKKKYLA